MIGKAIYDILSNDAAVSAITTRIYPQVAAPGAANPCIVYNCDTDYQYNKDNRTSAASIVNVDVQIDIYTTYDSDGYLDNDDLANKVILALDGYTGTNSGFVIDTIKMQDRQDFFDPGADDAGAYRTLLDLRARVEQ